MLLHLWAVLFNDAVAVTSTAAATVEVCCHHSNCSAYGQQRSPEGLLSSTYPDESCSCSHTHRQLRSPKGLQLKQSRSPKGLQLLSEHIHHHMSDAATIPSYFEGQQLTFVEHARNHGCSCLSIITGSHGHPRDAVVVQPGLFTVADTGSCGHHRGCN